MARHLAKAFVILLAMSTTLHADLRERIDALLGTKAAQRMTVGVRVTLMPRGEVLYSLRAEDLFVPASNVKLVSTASALTWLGGDFEYNTLFWTDGTLDEEGVLHGNLIIQGDGDPNLSGRFHRDDVMALPRAWADILFRRGIRTIDGDLIGNDRIFDRDFVCHSWPDRELDKWYGAGAGGLGFNDSCVDVVLNATGDGQPVRVDLTPPTRFVRVDNRCVTTTDAKVARQKPYYVSRRPGTNTLVVGGTMLAGRQSGTVNVAIENPPLFATTVVAESLLRRGIRIMGTAKLADETAPRVGVDDPRLLIIHNSKLADTVKVANRNSQGVYAESLLKRAGAARFGQGTYETGLRAAAMALQAAGIEEGTYTLVDGSGLGRANRFSPMQFTALLRWMYNGDNARAYVDSLARSGFDPGTLRNRLKEPEYRGRIAAKTGYVNGVSTLTGYAFTREGKVLAFSILMNNVRSLADAHRIADDICRAMIDEKIP